MEIAVPRAGLRRIREWLDGQRVAAHVLPVGGLKIRDPERAICLNFVELTRPADLSGLMEDAVEAATRDGHTLTTEDGVSLALVPVEHLVAIKLGTGEDEDRRDAIRLIRDVDVDVATIRRLAAKHLGVGGAIRFEVILREIGHPAKQDLGES